MTPVDEAQAITKAVMAIHQWDALDNAKRAAIVIRWCGQNGVAVTCDSEQLAAAMAHQKYWAQGPDDYLDMAMSLTAAFEAQS